MTVKRPWREASIQWSSAARCPHRALSHQDAFGIVRADRVRVEVRNDINRLRDFFPFRPDHTQATAGQQFLTLISAFIRSFSAF